MGLSSEEYWEGVALQHCKNEFFYKELIRKTGENFGVEVHTSDDGSIQQDVLALKVPELVEELINKLPLVIEALEKGYKCIENHIHPNQSLDIEELMERALSSLKKYKNIQKCEDFIKSNCCGVCIE